MQYDYLLKAVVIGNANAGKSKLIKKYCNPDVTNPSTIGVEFAVRTIEHKGKAVKLQIWDTAGQERFKAITSAYYRGAKVFVLVFDATNSESFKKIKYWSDQVDTFPENKHPIKLLVGTNAHLAEQVTVNADTARDFATKHKMEYFQVNIEKNINVDQIFISGVTSYFNQHPKLLAGQQEVQITKVDTAALASEIYELRAQMENLVERLQEKEVQYYEETGRKLRTKKNAEFNNAKNMSLGFGARVNPKIIEDNEMEVFSERNPNPES